MKKIIKIILARKILSGTIALFLIIGGYFSYAKIFSGGAIRYAIAQVQKGTIIVSTSGSGQVSASNQADIKPKASGEITAVYAKLGQEVDTGAILAVIDSAAAERAVRDAETALETAKLESDKMFEPLDALTLLQAENSLAQAKESKQKTEDNIKKAYEDGFNSVSSAFLDLPGIMTGLENTLFANTISPGSGGGDNITWYVNQTEYQNDQRNKAIRYRDDVHDAYNKARAAYTKNFDSYTSVSRTSNKQDIDGLISETYDTSQLISEAIKATDNYIDFIQDAMELRHLAIPAIVSTHQSNISLYTGKTNNILVNLLSAQRSLKDSEEAIASADRAIKERELSLAKIKKGPDDLDIRLKKITIRQKEDALTSAKQILADHYIRAPFVGVIAKLNVEKGDDATAGTIVATVVTKQKIAEISLNEVDIAKIKIDQKATLAFDAVPDLTISGQVAEVDTVGTISQGVVTYSIKIAFDTQDERVKPSMSVSAAIVTEAKQNVFLIPNSAVKSQGNISYVEAPQGLDMNTAITANVSKAAGIILKNVLSRQPVEVGISNDEFTEIVSGLKEGDVVVINTINTQNASNKDQQQNSSFRIPGLNTGSGGGFRSGGSR